ncbi:MAG: CHASE2 domain-containing protein [Leptolyngbyaceae cyanobacterium RU_5_1]|nr:CHASE2 domain-containing protein [Leptolyngbyaceae cyanobacterium RU_5_1]
MSLSFQLATRYLANQGIQPEFTPANELKLGSTVFKRLESKSGGYQTADAGGYQILLNYRSPENVARQVTLTDLLSGKIDPNWVRDRLVLIGYTAPSKKDDFWTPYSTGQQETYRMPGVIVHAQIVSQILSAVAGDRPLFWFWHEWQEGLWIAGWSLVGGILAWRIRHPVGFGIAVVVALGGLFGIGFALVMQTGWIAIASPAVGLIATAVSVVLVDRFEQGGYAKKIYRGVQKLFKIEIDEEEKSRQLAEYDGLIHKVQQWQQQSQEIEQQDSLANGEDASLRSPQVVDPAQTSDPSSLSTDDSEADYVEQLQRRVEALTQQEVTHQLIIELPDTEIEILEQYCQKSQRSQTDVLQELIRSLGDRC